MKICPQCHRRSNTSGFCPADGTELVEAGQSRAKAFHRIGFIFGMSFLLGSGAVAGLLLLMGRATWPQLNTPMAYTVTIIAAGLLMSVTGPFWHKSKPLLLVMVYFSTTLFWAMGLLGASLQLMGVPGAAWPWLLISIHGLFAFYFVGKHMLDR